MSKKSVSKTSPKTDNKKTVAAKTKPAKAEVKKAEKNTVIPARPGSKITRSTNTLASQITLLRKVSVAVYAILAVAAGALMTGATQQVRWVYQTRDALASQDSTVFTAGSKLLVEVPFRVALIVVLLLAAAFSLLTLTKLKDKYARAMQARVVGYRWVAVAITAGFMMEIVAMANGVQDLGVLKLLGASVMVTALISWLAERDNAVAGKPVWSAFTVSVFSGIFPWVLILGTVVGTALYGGGIRMPWWVYALDAALLLGFIAGGFNLFKSIKRKGQWADYERVERNYTAISLAFKASAAVILITGLMR